MIFTKTISSIYQSLLYKMDTLDNEQAVLQFKAIDEGFSDILYG